MGNITSIDNVKKYLEKTDTEDDALLGLIVAGVSQRVIHAISQGVTLQSFTEVIEVAVDTDAIVLDHFPILQVNGITEGDTVLTSADWLTDAPACIYRMTDGYRVPWAKGRVLVTYQTGFDEAAIPLDLVWDVTAQCAFEYKQTHSGGDRLGKSGSDPGGGDSTGYTKHDWLPVMLATIERYIPEEVL